MTSVEKSSAMMNRKWVLKSRPQGTFDPELHAELIDEPVDLTTIEVPDGKCVLRVEMLSVDAFVRTMLDEDAYHGTIPLGGTIPALGYGVVVKAGPGGRPKVGARLIGMVKAQTLATVDVGGALGVQPMPPTFGLPHSAALGLLGITTGMTAYCGVFCAAAPPAKGEVAVVSAAAGACGSIAAQLAKSTGARVIGIAGGAAKCAYLREALGVEAVDYKAALPVADQLDALLAGKQVNFYFDNVGGQTLDDVLLRIAPGGRVVVCGAVSQYSGALAGGRVAGPANYLKLAERGASMTGYNVMQKMWQWPLGFWTLRTYHTRGLVALREARVAGGVGAFAGALAGLFSGAHIGKCLVDLSG